MIAITSACSMLLRAPTTSFTPTPTSAPLSLSKTAAPKGPPPRIALSRESAIASRIRSSRVV
jgi:hypothetical protein